MVQKRKKRGWPTSKKTRRRRLFGSKTGGEREYVILRGMTKNFKKIRTNYSINKTGKKKGVKRGRMAYITQENARNGTTAM